MLQKSCLPLLVVFAFMFPDAARADLPGNPTLAANSTLNLDTGTTGTSGGDLLWSGSSMTPQGNATLYDIANLGTLTGLDQSFLSSFGPLYSKTPIPSSTLVATNVFAVHTNGGHYAAVLVTSNSGGTIALQYITFGASTGLAGPTITKLQNNYSYILPGLPNYGIAPGSLFIVQGAALNSQAPSALQSSAPPGLQTSLNGTTSTVTVSGTITHPFIYYTSATQLGLVLPSTTPVGPGTITVTNGTQTSPPATIQVVASAFGIDSYFGTGTGLAVAQDLKGNLISPTSSASPLQILTFWGSGVGADKGNDDKVFPQNLNNLTSVPFALYIGGISADIAYRGRSQYPGVDVVVATVPRDVKPGCNVAVETVSGNVVSNFVTLPVAVGGGKCSDPTGFGYSPDLLALANANGSLRIGSFLVGKFTSEGGGSDTQSIDQLSANFSSITLSTIQTGGATPSLGSCVVNQFTDVTGATSVGLDAGTVSSVTPVGSYTLVPTPTVKGSYGLIFLTGISGSGIISDGTRLTAGGYTFNATGGVDVGPATASINFPNTFVWTNDSAITIVDRNQPLTITWSGGTAGGVVFMSGTSNASNSLGASFTCYADALLGTFTIPTFVLLPLPPSFVSAGIPAGSLSVFEFVMGNTFTARGLDFGSISFDQGTSKAGVAYK